MIGTTYAQINALYPGVIASNLSGQPATSSRYVAHQHVAGAWRQTTPYCDRDPSGQTQACYTFQNLYDEFITSRACNKPFATQSYIAKCALGEALTFGVKHKLSLLDHLGRGLTLLQIGQWVWEGYNWCVANATACESVVGYGMCTVEDYACNGGSLDSATTFLSTGVDDGLAWMEGGGENSLLRDMSGGFPMEDPSGYGSWGVMDEMSSDVSACMKLGNC